MSERQAEDLRCLDRELHFGNGEVDKRNINKRVRLMVSRALRTIVNGICEYGTEE